MKFGAKYYVLKHTKRRVYYAREDGKGLILAEKLKDSCLFFSKLDAEKSRDRFNSAGFGPYKVIGVHC